MNHAPALATMLIAPFDRQDRSYLAACRGDAQAAMLLTRRPTGPRAT
jgi:hypothetical protein